MTQSVMSAGLVWAAGLASNWSRGGLALVGVGIVVVVAFGLLNLVRR